VQLGEAAHGVYGLTRNTVYLSMMLPYVGVAFLVNSSWMLIAALPTVSPLCLTAIIAGAILLGERYQ
jgi:protein-S-isoprenylcysteine O-methyltransferase Ste14